MRITRRKLRKILEKSLLEGYGIAAADREREVSKSSFEEAQADAKANGKAYFVQNDGEIVVFDSDGNADMFDGTNKDALDNNDGNIHYIGQI